jgi:hypothetical protein
MWAGSRSRRAAALQAVAVGAALLTGACARPGAACRTQVAPAHAPDAAPAPALALAEPLAVGPLTFFNQSCARCHGQYGSFYGEGFAAQRTDADLARVVREMVTGPAQASLPRRDLDALTAYHRSLADGRPFVALTHKEGTVLAGEVTPRAAVVLRAAGRLIPAQVVEHAWTLDFSDSFPAGAGALPTPVILEATLDGRSTTLDLAGSPYSHSAPPPAR